MSTERSLLASILFADVRGFSRLRRDELIAKVQGHIEEFRAKHLTPQNHFHYRTWGDGIIVCSYDPDDLLEISLHLNEWFYNTNWQRKGFDQPLELRIGMHVAKIGVIEEAGLVVDIFGSSVATAARIEPIVEPGRIYCSAAFKTMVSAHEGSYVKFVDLGARLLAKEFGELHLYQVENARLLSPAVNSRASPAAHGSSLGAIKIRKEFTQLEKEAYLEDTYKKALTHFQSLMEALQRQDTDVVARLAKVREDKFTCQVFVRGAKRSECQIWLGGSFGKGLCYYEGITENDNSMNEAFHCESDGFRLFLKGFGMGFSSIGPSEVASDIIGEILGQRFLKTLER